MITRSFPEVPSRGGTKIGLERVAEIEPTSINEEEIIPLVIVASVEAL